MEELKKILREHKDRYPELVPVDLVKLIYQNEFGCGHFITDEQASLARLQAEAEGIEYSPGELFEPIGNGLVRLHLRHLGGALPLETVNRFFSLTAGEERGSKEGFEAKLELLRELFPSAELDAYLAAYKEAGYPPASHSQAYREHYSPSYRIVSSAFALYFPVFERIEELLVRQGAAVIAIDGRSGSGKSFLGRLLHDVYGCPVIAMDHFFLRPEQRTSSRLAEPGGNVDYERFMLEAGRKLQSGEGFRYRIYHCQTNSFSPSPEIGPHRLTVVEGCYSHHPALSELYDLKVFLTVDPQLQQKRLLERSGPAMLERFLNEWIPLEELYFSALNIAGQADVCVAAGE